MGAIHNKIKKIREQSGLTQQDVADKLCIHLKTWQKIENGITRLDLDRLHQIAEILETTVEDLINVEDSVYINAIKDNDVGFNNSSVTINHKSKEELDIYQMLLVEKDKVATLSSENAVLKYKLEQLEKNQK